MYYFIMLYFMLHRKQHYTKHITLFIIQKFTLHYFSDIKNNAQAHNSLRGENFNAKSNEKNNDYQYSLYSHIEVN